jgi:hypothetical protein
MNDLPLSPREKMLLRRMAKGWFIAKIRLSMGGRMTIRRRPVDFDPSFTSCSARVSLGYQSGKTSISFSPITKKQVEMKSMTASGISCSIRAGNRPYCCWISSVKADSRSPGLRRRALSQNHNRAG